MNEIYIIIKSILPIFILILFGMILNKFRIIDKVVLHGLGDFVFIITLPSLIILKLSSANFEQYMDVNFIIFICIALLTTFLILGILSYLFISERNTVGTFVQGAFRSNFAIVGLALILELLSKDTFNKALIVTMVTIPLFTLLSVFILHISSDNSSNSDMGNIFIKILKTPLVLAIVIGILLSLTKIEIPNIALTVLDYLGSLTFPLALISIGASLSLVDFKHNLKLTILASLIKNIMLPGIIVVLAIMLGFRRQNLTIIAILFACPTAIASFITVQGIGGNVKLARNIIFITTMASTITIPFALYVLEYFKFINN